MAAINSLYYHLNILTQLLSAQQTITMASPPPPSSLVIDRYWLEQSDNRNQPEYLNEAFQQLILRFILDNCGKDFMDHPVHSTPRSVEPVPQSEKHSTTTLQARNAEEIRKRPSPQPSIEEGSSKRPRLDPDSDVAEDSELILNEDIPDEDYPEEIEEMYESEEEM